MSADGVMRDAEAIEEERMQYGHGPLTEEELDEKYPNRPHNHSKTLPFHDLYLTLFNPLNDNRKKPSGPVMARKKQGPHGQTSLSPNEVRRMIIERFISRWRKEVGDDIYPAFRLIVPEKDRDRAMYGLKEKTIGKLLVRAMRIDKNSEDGYNLMNWKLPGQKAVSAMAGDFAGRCFEVVSKRPMRTTPGDMTIAEVNEALDKLSAAQKEEDQYPIINNFYKRMNADELMWLVRIILRQMKVGATEKTIFEIWHPDAENLFNVSSSLRRVCWELYDPNLRLESEEVGITLMQCFQPQLAQFQMHSFEKMIQRMRPSEEDDTFWIEEKLDGERMQLHVVEDDDTPGGKRFCFWSRKAKDYTYLYGNGFFDDNSALTRHLKDAFDDGVRNIILDGEMITWDPEQDAIVPFGTLKTAALSEQKNPFSTTGHRPLYKVFDCLYLNDQVLTSYTLRDRHRALEASVKDVHRRMEVHSYVEGRTTADVEVALRRVVAESSEGLVLKNPRSMYKLNDRDDDWMKVKPEYMTEFGEALDCIVIGGYYGSGRRGGNLSSFLCGLKVDDSQIAQGADPMKCYSFFKVGGGFAASDYASIRHATDGKWKEWDAKKPPTKYIELAGGDRQFEKPDMWIKPDESVVFEVKAASISTTDQFRIGMTLRFPRFKKLRTDKDWQSALTIRGFLELKSNIEQEQKEKQFKVDDSRRKRIRITRKMPLVVAGSDVLKTPYAGPETKIFEGITFYIMTESLTPKKSKAELEQLVKANGGNLRQTSEGTGVMCIAEKKLVPVASLIKRGTHDIIRPVWLFDCLKQSEADSGRQRFLLPVEPRHIFFASETNDGNSAENVDEFGDSYARDVSVEELREIFQKMPRMEVSSDPLKVVHRMEERGLDLESLPSWMFLRTVAYFDRPNRQNGADVGPATEQRVQDVEEQAIRHGERLIDFAGGRIAFDLDDFDLTHVIVSGDQSKIQLIRQQISRRHTLPRMVTLDWVEQSWREKTLLDEERFVPI